MIGLAFLLDFPMKSSWSIVTRVLITVAMAGFYLIIHELTHGIFCYLLSGIKPTYAVRLPYFATGSQVYFNKTSFIIVALAPVVIWGIFLTLMIILFPPDFFKTVYIVLAINFAGASGDIFLSYKLSKLPTTAFFQDKSGTDPKVYMPVARLCFISIYQGEQPQEEFRPINGPKSKQAFVACLSGLESVIFGAYIPAGNLLF